MQSQAEEKPLDAIHHIAVSVNDIDKAVEWYVSQFNCKVTYQDKSWAFLDFANIKLALVLPDQHPAHIAFISAEAEKFGELKQHRDGTRSLYITDPMGNAVEILAKE